MPHPDDNDFQEMDPSPVSTQDEPVVGAQDAPPEGQAASSAATGEPVDTLSVVRDVVKESRTDGSASPAEGVDDGQQAGATASQKEPDNENFSDVPFHKHPRFQQLLRSKKNAEVDAVRSRNIETFLADEGLTAGEAADMLRVVALARRDPVAAWERAKPWVQNLLVAAGEVVPEDLAARVQRGELTHDAAVEVSRSRAAMSSVQRQEIFRNEQAQRREQQSAATAVISTVEAWEADRRLKDPNFEAKLAPLQREIAYLHATEGKPRTADAVKEQLQRAYKAVNDGFRPSAAPSAQRRPAIRPVTGGQANGNAPAASQTTLDIVRANRRAAR